MKHIAIPLGVMLAFGLLFIAAPVEMPHAVRPLVGPASAIDGDTIELSALNVRLHGIDAPEHGQDCARADGSRWACGRAAKGKLAALIDREIVTCTKIDTDRKGRMVARCTVNEIDINREMVRAGLAVAYRRYTKVYDKDENLARMLKLGIWQGEFVVPEQYRRTRR